MEPKDKKIVKQVSEIHGSLGKIDAIHNELTTANGTIKRQSDEMHTELTDDKEGTIKEKTKRIHKQLTSADDDTIRSKVLALQNLIGANSSS